MLVKLQKAINSKLECVNFFDVYDLQDAEEERVAFTPSVCEDHFVEGKITVPSLAIIMIIIIIFIIIPSLATIPCNLHSQMNG